MRKFLAPCWPRVTAESRVAEEGAQPVNVINIRDNSNNCSSTDQISRLNRELCLWTGSSASCQQWLQSGSSVSSWRLVCSFPEHTWRPNRWHIPSLMFYGWAGWMFFTWTLFWRAAWLWTEPLFRSLCDTTLWVNMQELFSGCIASTEGPLGEGMGWARGLDRSECVGMGELRDFWLVWEKPEWDVGFLWALLEMGWEPLCLKLVTELLSWCLTGFLCAPILELWNETCFHMLVS